MHTLVLSFFKMYVEHATITDHVTKRTKISNDCSNHARNGSDGFRKIVGLRLRILWAKVPITN